MAIGTGLFELLTVCVLLRPISASPLGLFGPYWVYAEKMYQCNPKEGSGKMFLDLRVSKFDVRKPNVLQTITGTFNTTRPLIDGMWGRARADGYSNGEWKPNALVFTFKEKACSSVRTHIPLLFTALFKREAEGQKECYIRPGVYTVVNEPINWTFPKFPVLPYGFWRFHVTAGLGDDVYGCHNTEGRSVPRRH